VTTVFTTHTPVPAGNEKFDMSLIRKYLSDKIGRIGMSVDDFSRFAMIENDNNFFMPALAIRFSSFINGVSILHSRVSKEMWHSIYPNLYEDEMPIRAITNGVHLQTWLSRQLTRLFDRYIGPDYLHMAEKKSVWQNIMNIPDHEIWEAHQRRKEQMISFIREKIAVSVAHHGTAYSLQKPINTILNPNFLTVGFARRYATYKRGTLILSDPERLLTLIRDHERPIQFVFSGKAHPADEKGKTMIKEILDFARKNQIEDRFVFVENYDIDVAKHLVQGVDVWLNNPIRPQEASGTSGMKAGVNGALNLSVLDGWWPECYEKYNGWAVTSGEDVEDPLTRDKLESNEIYDLLENTVRKIYYDRDENGLPNEWVRRMKQSMHDVGLGFNIHRMLRNYIDEFYIPGEKIYEMISENNYEKMREILARGKKIGAHWDKISFIDYETELNDNEIIDSDQEINVRVNVYLDEAEESLFQVELFYRMNTAAHEVFPLHFVRRRENNIAEYIGTFKIIGAGNQEINFRIRPVTCNNCKEYHEYVKWFF